MLKVVDLRTGKELGVNQDGELCFKGPSVSRFGLLFLAAVTAPHQKLIRAKNMMENNFFFAKSDINSYHLI